MKLFPTLALAVLVLSCPDSHILAQTSVVDSVSLRNNVFLYADSMIKAYQLKQWDLYCRLSHPGVIRYWGGEPRYIQVSQQVGEPANPLPAQMALGVGVIQLVQKEDHWQAVIERIRETVIDGKKARVLTYMVGRSYDEGLSWKFFEINEGMLDNARRIMPEIADEIRIPQRRVVYLDDPEPLQEPVIVKKRVPTKAN